MVEPLSIVEHDVKNKERSSDTASVAIDIATLSQQVFSTDSASTPRSPSSSLLMKSLSRKGIQIGEKKPLAATLGHQSTGGTGGSIEKSTTLHVNVSVEGEGHPATPTFSSGVKKRIGMNRRSAPWLDPKRVLFLFATLSSIGTLILIYFTLSMGKTNSGDTTEW